MILAIKPIDTGKERKPGGLYGGDGKWDTYECEFKSGENTGSFLLAINLESKQVDIQPLHPSDAGLLSKAFHAIFHFKASRN